MAFNQLIDGISGSRFTAVNLVRAEMILQVQSRPISQPRPRPPGHTVTACPLQLWKAAVLSRPWRHGLAGLLCAQPQPCSSSVRPAWPSGPREPGVLREGQSVHCISSKNEGFGIRDGFEFPLCPFVVCSILLSLSFFLCQMGRKMGDTFNVAQGWMQKPGDHSLLRSPSSSSSSLLISPFLPGWKRREGMCTEPLLLCFCRLCYFIVTTPWGPQGSTVISQVQRVRSEKSSDFCKVTQCEDAKLHLEARQYQGQGPHSGRLAVGLRPQEQPPRLWL